MGSNQYQTIKESLFETAISLVEDKIYEELPPTNGYSECTAILIDNHKKTFWFTTEKVLKHTKKIIQLNKENLN